MKYGMNIIMFAEQDSQVASTEHWHFPFWDPSSNLSMDINYSEFLHTFLRDLNTNIVVVPQIKGHPVVQLDEALRYRPEGHGFDSRWCHQNFALT